MGSLVMVLLQVYKVCQIFGPPVHVQLKSSEYIHDNHKFWWGRQTFRLKLLVSATSQNVACHHVTIPLTHIYNEASM